MNIPILGGVYTDQAGDYQIAYPVNMRPIPIDSGLSKGYLRPSDGLVKLGNGPGYCRGGINWNGVVYRVLGTKLVSIDEAGVIVIKGDVGTGGQCTMDYSFDRLAITSGGRLYYWDGATLQQVVDPDLGNALDAVWVDGYFMTTDGKYLVVTDLANPMSVNAIKYGSSEIDPDPIECVLKLRNEVYAVNRYTIEVFRNVGGSGFPFARINGAQVQRGAVGTNAACVFADETIAFVGGGRSESIGIYLAGKSQSQKISTRAIDTAIAAYSEAGIAAIRVESYGQRGITSLWVHLPDRTFVYDLETSMAVQSPVWHVMTAGVTGYTRYPASSPVWAYNRWNIANAGGNEYGYLSDKVSDHWGGKCRWEFSTSIVYNEGRGVIFYELELTALTGHVAIGADPTISASYSTDGETWSQEKFIHAGKQGQVTKRLVWFKQGSMANWRIQRFRGDSDAFLSVNRLDARVEPLNV